MQKLLKSQVIGSVLIHFRLGIFHVSSQYTSNACHLQMTNLTANSHFQPLLISYFFFPMITGYILFPILLPTTSLIQVAFNFINYQKLI